jgi:hypothetical protein
VKPNLSASFKSSERIVAKPPPDLIWACRREPNRIQGRFADGVFYDASANGAIAITGELRVSVFL